jgi:TRAP-type C4-dicarboxylate transport system substrate-binding protein
MGVTDLIQFKIYQVAKYLTLTRHVSPVNLFIVSKSFMNRLSPGDREIVREAGRLGAEAQLKAVLAGEGAALNQLKMRGMHVFDVKDRNAFAAKVQPVLANATAQVGADIMKLARAAAES